MPPAPSATILLPRTGNQAAGLASYCREFLAAGRPIGASTLARLERFHLDAVACGVSALSHGTAAPSILEREALASPPSAGSRGGICLGGVDEAGGRPCAVEKAVAANVSAMREWDANGTNFGSDPAAGRTAGEFGHNDFYPVAVAAAREAGLDGDATLRVMLLIDEIRGRLAEVFALRRHAIDHVHHGTVACAAAYAAALGGSVDRIESAIGMAVAHYVPYRAIRAGHQLSDSKGASAALAAEAAVLSARRALAGFRGPADVFRNPLSLYRVHEPCPDGQSPFDLELGIADDAFCIHGMHFKLGLYEHQSAGAIEGVVRLVAAEPRLAADLAGLRRIRVAIYEPACSIIADPAKRSPATRQSADHSLPYIVARTLLKARTAAWNGRPCSWESLMLLPEDYAEEAILDPEVADLMARIVIVPGGPDYDARYPEGIPTSVDLEHEALGIRSSGLVMYPPGHARSDADRTERLLDLKFDRLVAGAVADPGELRDRVRVGGRSAAEIAELYAIPIRCQAS